MTTPYYWLPENHLVRLTALELGGLIAAISAARAAGIGTSEIRKPRPRTGEPIPISLIDRIEEKVLAAQIPVGPAVGKMGDYLPSDIDLVVVGGKLQLSYAGIVIEFTAPEARVLLNRLLIAMDRLHWSKT